MAGKKIVKNFFLLSSGQIFSQVIAFLALVYLARIIGPESLGKIGFAQVYTSYFMFFTDIGLNLLGVREIAGERRRINELTNTILSIRLSLATILFVVLAVLNLFLFQETDLRILIVIYGLTIFSFAAALDFLFLGAGRSGLIGVVNSIRAVLFLGLLVLFVKSGNDLYKVAVFFLVSYLVSTICYFAFGKVSVDYTFKLKLSARSWKKITLAALPLGLITILSVFTQQQSVLLLGFFNEPADVGLYYGIFKIIFMALFIISLYGDTIYPLLTDTRGGNVFRASLQLLALILLPAMLLVNYFNAEIIKIVLGDEYAGGAYIFKMLVWIIPLTAVLTVFNKTLIAGKHDGKCMAANACGFAVSILAGLFLVSQYGMAGAATSHILSLVVANLFMGYYVFKTKTTAIETAGAAKREKKLEAGRVLPDA